MNGRGKFTVAHGEFEPIVLALGEQGYISQGNATVVFGGGGMVRELVHRLAAWSEGIRPCCICHVGDGEDHLPWCGQGWP